MAPRTSSQTLLGVVGAVAFAVATAAVSAPTSAQSSEPIKIGFSLALTGPLAPNGLGINNDRPSQASASDG